MLQLIAGREKPQERGARAELRRHLAQIAELNARIEPLRDAQHKRHELRERERQLAAELDAVNDAEKHDWQEHVAAGSHGERPKPRTAERNQVVAALAEANCRVQAPSVHYYAAGTPPRVTI